MYTRRDQQPDAVWSRQIGGQQHPPEGSIAARLDQKLRVDGHDLMRAAIHDRVGDPIECLVLGHIVDRHAQDGDSGTVGRVLAGYH